MDARQPDDVWHAVVPGLDPLERRALGMIYVDRLTQRQIADRLRISQAAVAAAVARAMRTVARSVDLACPESVESKNTGPSSSPSHTA